MVAAGPFLGLRAHGPLAVQPYEARVTVARKGGIRADAVTRALGHAFPLGTGPAKVAFPTLTVAADALPGPIALTVRGERAHLPRASVPGKTLVAKALPVGLSVGTSSNLAHAVAVALVRAVIRRAVSSQKSRLANAHALGALRGRGHGAVATVSARWVARRLLFHVGAVRTIPWGPAHTQFQTIPVGRGDTHSMRRVAVFIGVARGGDQDRLLRVVRELDGGIRGVRHEHHKGDAQRCTVGRKHGGCRRSRQAHTDTHTLVSQTRTATFPRREGRRVHGP